MEHGQMHTMLAQDERMPTELLLKALHQHPQAAEELAPTTLRRYSAGRVPQSVQWILRHPRMLRYLADLIETQENNGGSSSRP